MADLTQRVKYQVQVDTADLDKLNTAVTTANTGLSAMASAIRSIGTASDTAKTKLDKFTAAVALHARGVDKSHTAMQGFYRMNQMLGNQSTVLTAALEQLAQNLAIVAGTAKEAKGALNSTTNAMAQVHKETNRTAEASERTGRGFLYMFGKFQAIKWIASQVFESLKDGAQQLDLDRVLGKQIDGYVEKLKDAKQATAGMVLEGDLKKTMALMSSLGVPINNFAEQMELVQKLALRTGQDAKWLTESWGLAISRLSPRIADNLGITISLKDAYEVYGRQIGKASTELTKHEQILAMMNAMMERGKELTKDVDLTKSTTVAVQRFENFFKDLWEGIKEKGGQAIEAIDRTFESNASTFQRALSDRREQIKLWYQQMPVIFAAADKRVAGSNVLQESNKAAEEALRRLDTAVALAKTNLGNLFGGDYAEIFSRMEGEIYKRAEAAIQRVRAGIPGAVLENFDDLGATNFGAAAFDLINARVEDNAKMMDALHDKYRGVVSEAEFLRIKEEGLNKARAYAIEDIEKLRRDYGGINEASTLALINARTYNRELFKAATWLEGMLRISIANAKIAREHEVAFQGQLDLATRLDQQYETRKMLADGMTLTEVSYNKAKERESELNQEIEKAWKEYHKAYLEGQGKDELNRVRMLQAQRKGFEDERAQWQLRARSEEEWIKQFDTSSKAVQRAEIDRIEANLDVLKIQQQQLKTLNLIGAIIGPQVEDSIKSTENLLERLYAKLNRGGYGGAGRMPKEDAKFSKPIEFGEVPELNGDLEKMRKLSELLNKMSTLNRTWAPGSAMAGRENTLLGISPEATEKSAKALKEYSDGMAALRAEMGDERFIQAFNQVAKDDPERVALLSKNLEDLTAHFDKLVAIADPLERFTTALGSFAAGMDDLFGKNYIGLISDLTSSTQAFTEALKNNASAYGLTNAAMPIVRSFTNNMIKDRRARAAVEGAMQAAAAWAAFAEFNYVGAAAHAVAAGLYFGVAGGALRLPKGKNREEKADSGKMTQSKMRDVHIHIDGAMVYTEAERGFYIRQAIMAAEKEGM